MGSHKIRGGRGGYREDIGSYFRSSMEANVARYLEWLLLNGVIHSWLYEPQTFEFPIKRGNKYYVPDFKVIHADGSHEWWETKGYMDNDSRIRIKRFRKFYPDEKLIVVDWDQYKAIERDIKPMIPNWE